jgi:predicted ribosomally synthesized peptide with nif11-like leader
MADDQFKAFLEAVAADSSLQEKLNSVADADAVVAIAKEAGFVISAEAVENHLKEKIEDSEEELTDGQLEAVAGGWVNGYILPNGLFQRK